MEESRYVPIEKMAKGRSTLFNFVSLRSPDTPDTRASQILFVHHLGFSQSLILKQVGNPDAYMDYEDWMSIIGKFSAVKTLDKLQEYTQELWEYSDWLARNRKILTVKDKPNVANLTSEKEIVLWDNLFYHLATKQSPVLVDKLTALLIANDFIKKSKAGIIATDSEYRRAASAKVVVPRVVMSRPEKETTLAQLRQSVSKLNYNPVDESAISSKIAKYENASKELQRVQSNFISDLIKFDPAAVAEDPNTGEGEDANAAHVNPDKLIDKIGNPLSESNLSNLVSQETIEVVHDLKLESLRDPEKAILQIDAKVRELSQSIFEAKTLSKKAVLVGGSVIELDLKPTYLSRFTAGCFPTIVDQENIAINESLKMISCTGGGPGSSGGASSNTIADVGSISFEITKFPQLGSGYFVGLSHSNPNASSGTIKYSVFVTSFVGNDGTTWAKAIPVKNGSFLSGEVQLLQEDSIKISRGLNSSNQMVISWHRLRPSTGVLTLMTSQICTGNDITESLILDFAFQSRNQAIYNVLIEPCSKPGDSADDPDACSGLTNLGVSDYMRVEQEVCCYVPGEVSHIENVLQGEYKERSTRRLRREETTVTVETETTTEKLRDTSTTDRYEMEKETSEVIQKDQEFTLGVNMTAHYGPVSLSVNTGFATATSSQNASSQAVTYAQEVSNRALDSVVTRVREERVNKIIEEYEENNMHGLDNRNNPNGHVTGIYRWVDKIYKNQVVNYGKRLTFEFMIPEPAKFFLWAMASPDSSAGLDIPEDPRQNGLPKHSSLTEANYAEWAAEYAVQVPPPPALYKKVSKAYHFEKDTMNLEVFAKSFNDMQVPDGYTASYATVWRYWIWKDNSNYKVEITVGNTSYQDNSSAPVGTNTGYYDLGGIEGVIPIAVAGDEVYVMKLNVVATCTRKPELLEQWKIDVFNKIVDSYLNKKAQYENAMAQAKSEASMGIQISGNNPLFNRITERQELQKGCLQWLEAKYGEGFYDAVTPCADSVDMPEMNTQTGLGCYAQKAKFFEQAFDWDIMTYLFYPYFWGKKCSWKEVFKLDDNDPIFRGFLQAGMARVAVPVKPNYEAAVLYYLESGEVWNGGEPPVTNDPLYIPIISDLADQEPNTVGDPWESRLPTSLNILQKDSGSVAGDGLPCNCDNYDADGTGGSVLSGENADGN